MLQPKQRQEHGNANQQTERRVYRPQRTPEGWTRDFKSNDLALPARNLRWDRENSTDILGRVDVLSVTEHLRELLESKQTLEINETCGTEIREYLYPLDLGNL